MSRPRLSGYPTSSNRASSFHLHWLPRLALVEVSVTIEIAIQPEVEELYFWALQASFAGPAGIRGGAHLGLQWHPSHPGSTAANWGGYDRGGSILEGTQSTLPSALGNPHTRDYRWRPQARFRLRIRGDGPGWWAGEITDIEADTTTVVRSLRSEGTSLTLPMVWSEVFARCDADPVVVVWSDPSGVTVDREPWHPDSYSVTYQREEDGGCSNTDVRVLPHGVGQFTGITRMTPPGTIIPV
ncbi:MAG: hypothetical protein ACRDWH_11295 [Acidimicrobiia bacterium]